MNLLVIKHCSIQIEIMQSYCLEIIAHKLLLFNWVAVVEKSNHKELRCLS